MLKIQITQKYLNIFTVIPALLTLTGMMLVIFSHFYLAKIPCFIFYSSYLLAGYITSFFTAIKKHSLFFYPLMTWAFGSAISLSIVLALYEKIFNTKPIQAFTGPYQLISVSITAIILIVIVSYTVRHTKIIKKRLKNFLSYNCI